MFFLLRMAFWLGVVLVLLPSGASQRVDRAGEVRTSEAISAASATVQDLRGFCMRQPGACSVGSQVAVAIGYKAQAGAKVLYDFLTEALAPKDTGTVAHGTLDHGTLDHGTAPRGGAAKVEPVKSSTDRSQNTLTPTDLAPAWRGPQLPKDAKHAA